MSEYQTTLMITWAMVAAGLTFAAMVVLMEELLPWFFDDEHCLALPNWKAVLLVALLIVVWPAAMVVFIVGVIAYQNRWAKRYRKNRRTHE